MNDNLSKSSSSSSSSHASNTPDISALTETVRKKSTYQSHLNLVNALRVASDLQPLRAARQQFSRTHPLDPSVWIEWINDELSLADTRDDRIDLLPLFNRAENDFLHVSIHALHLQTVFELWKKGQIDQETLEQVIVRALNLGAFHHFTEGHLIWQLYISVLQALNKTESLVQPCFESHKTPLASQLQTFERKISHPQTEHTSQSLVHAYMCYITFLKEAYPSAIISVYERMITANFSYPPAWIHYLSHASSLPQKQHFVFVAERAIRNVPHCIQVWDFAVLTAPHASNPLANLARLLQNVEPFVTTSTDFASAELLSKQAWSVFLALGAPEQLLPQLKKSLAFNVRESVPWAAAMCHAACVLVASNRLEEAILLFEDVVNTRPTETRWRLHYATAVSAKSAQAVRTMFERGLTEVVSTRDLNILRDAWQAFEISVPGADGLLDRLRAIENIATAKRAQHASQPRGDRDPEKGSKRTRRNTNATAKRQRTKDSAKTEKYVPSQQNVSSILGDVAQNGNAENATIPMVGQNNSGQKSGEEGQLSKGARKPRDSKTKNQSHDVVQDANSGPEPNTIFISNLPYSIKTEEIRQAFCDTGEIREIRVPCRSDGVAKGIAYIEYEDEASVQRALKKHLHAIHGRSMSVKRSQPPQKKRRAERRSASSVRRPNTGPQVHKRRQKIITKLTNDESKDVDMIEENIIANRTAKSEEQNLSQSDFQAMLQ